VHIIFNVHNVQEDPILGPIYLSSVCREFKFRIHGDNIVECERTLSLIEKGLFADIVDKKGPLGSAIAPSFQFKLKNSGIYLIFTFFPGFRRWNKDILSLIHDRGGMLREAPDVVITREGNASEEPILAIEYCGALPAGNQAWQRNGRAYSLGKACVPYIYVAELGGFELNIDRSKKSSRYPNPAVPFSYLCLSHSLKLPMLPVFIPNPSVLPRSKQFFDNIFGYNELVLFIRSQLIGESSEKIVRNLEKKDLDLVCLLASARPLNDSLTPEEWRGLYDHISSNLSISSYLQHNSPKKWAKKPSIKGLTLSAKGLMNLASKYSIGLTSSNLPLCLILASNRNDFLKGFCLLYPNISSEFIDWLSRKEDLAICWIMGFKPGGDDARPDRGLAPFCRMLIGDSMDLLTVVYGPVPSDHLNQLNDNPTSLMGKNGLWESILALSDAVFVDSSTIMSNTGRAYTKQHWISALHAGPHTSFFVSTVPIRFSENDVDTALHLLFSHFSDRHDIDVFEGLCNPPGGDWSGISLRTADNKKELRWLSLPRVTKSHAKRPDHLFQIFDRLYKSIALIVESKERFSDIEPEIGSKLKEYVSDLIISPPSVEKYDGNEWIQPSLEKYPDRIQFVSAAAFIINRSQELESIAKSSDVDLILGFKFGNFPSACTIMAYPCTKLGKHVYEIIKNIKPLGVNMDIKKYQ